jgi:CRP-like cAMP-binding protein
MGSDSPSSRPVDEAAALAVYGALKLEGFFPEFGAEVCGKLFPRSGVCSYAPGQRVIEQGEAGRDLFVVLSGALAVAVSMGSAAAEVAVLGPGDLIGEVALLRDGVRTATVTANSPCEVYRLAFADLGYVLEHNPELAAHLRGLAERRTA